MSRETSDKSGVIARYSPEAEMFYRETIRRRFMTPEITTLPRPAAARFDVDT
ncbi:hypothetical protein V2I52_20090 [Brenneria sp. g21c3]|uniref:hypothetical protein n=1 Tax=Brenneria sp. g21c3 TaxID=3093893 RepID=UPI002EB236E4|nr:hypothetical protein [Brenneria sp. g21c3]